MNQKDKDHRESNLYLLTGIKIPTVLDRIPLQDQELTRSKYFKLKNNQPKKKTNQKIPRYNEWIGAEEGDKFIQALKDENNDLKSEVESLTQYLSSALSIYNQLQLENKKSIQLVAQKDLDIKRLLETMLLNENENSTDYELQINLLLEQVDLLTKHLEELKSAKDQYTFSEKNQQSELQRAKLYSDKLNSNLEAALQREKALTNEAEQLKFLNYSLTDHNNTLTIEVEDLKSQLENLDKNNVILSRDIHQIEGEHDTKLKELTQKVKLLEQDNQKLQNQMSKKISSETVLKINIQDIENEREEMRVLISCQTLLNDKLEKDLQNRQEQLKLEIERRNVCFQRENQTANQLAQAKEEIKTLKQTLIQIEGQLKKKTKDLDDEIYQQSQKHVQTLEKIKKQYYEDLQRNEIIIQQLEKEIQSLKQEIENQTKQHLQSENKIKELNKKQKNQKELETKLEGLDHDIKSKNNQITIQENQLNEYKVLLNNNRTEHSDRNEILEQKILQLENEINYLNSQQEQYMNLASALQQLQRENMKIIEENEYLNDTIEKIKNKDQTLRHQYEDAETTLISLQQQNRQLQQQLKLDENLRQKLEEFNRENQALRDEVHNLDKILLSTKRNYNSNDSTRPSSTMRKADQDIKSPNPYLNEYNSNQKQTATFQKNPNMTFSASQPKLEIKKMDNTQQVSLMRSPSDYNKKKQKLGDDVLVYDIPIHHGNKKPVLVNYRHIY